MLSYVSITITVVSSFSRLLMILGSKTANIFMQASKDLKMKKSMLECIDIAETYRIMTSKTMKTLEVQVFWGPNVSVLWPSGREKTCENAGWGHQNHTFRHLQLVE